MKRTPQNKAPMDGKDRKKIKPVICYPVDTLPLPDIRPVATITHDKLDWYGFDENRENGNNSQ